MLNKLNAGSYYYPTEGNKNSCRKHDIYMETKCKGKGGGLTPKKKNINDSPTAPILKSIDIFNDADNS